MSISKRHLLFTLALTAVIACTAFPLFEERFATIDEEPMYTITDTELMKSHAAFRKVDLKDDSVIESISTSSSLYELYPSSDLGTTTHVRISDSCDAFFGGECLNVRSGPSSTFPVVAQVRTHAVLSVERAVEQGSSTWYQIDVDEHLHYPERVTTDWYITGDYVEPLHVHSETTNPKGPKRIAVDISDQLLTAYEGDTIVQQIRISTGLHDTPTPVGHFAVLRKTPSRYMQGPLENGRRTITEEVDESHPDYYDLPGVPWNLYFTHDGAVIHGAYWHVSFGSPQSHGCVNVPPNVAEDLYHWAEIGTPIHVTQ